MVGKRHPEMGLRAHRQPDTAALRHEKAERPGQQGDPVIVRARGGPAADFRDPRPRHDFGADGRDDGHGPSRPRQDDEPWARGAFPEAGQETGDVEDVRRRREQKRVDIAGRQRRLQPRTAPAEFLDREGLRAIRFRALGRHEPARPETLRQRGGGVRLHHDDGGRGAPALSRMGGDGRRQCSRRLPEAGHGWAVPGVDRPSRRPSGGSPPSRGAARLRALLLQRLMPGSRAGTAGPMRRRRSGKARCRARRPAAGPAPRPPWPRGSR